MHYEMIFHVVTGRKGVTLKLDQAGHGSSFYI